MIVETTAAAMAEMERIRGAGGVGFLARDCRDVLRELKGTV